MDKRVDSLMKTLERNHHRWTETIKGRMGGDEFISDDMTEEERKLMELLSNAPTEEVTIKRDEIISTDTTEEERDLMESVAADAAQISTEDLLTFVNKIKDFWPRPFDEVYMELIRRGDESWACTIDNPVMLQELCDKGIKEAAEQLYQKYRYGDEKNGIFIDKKTAKTYHDLADDAVYEQYTTEDFPDEEDPKTFHYTLIGNAATLDGVETLINDLCQRFGTPNNELGLFVPQQMLIKVIVGSYSEYYRGNVLTMQRESPDRLAIITEADKGEPLFYALQKVFPNINIALN